MLMKRTITLFMLLMFTGLILPSCGITIVKRQHTRGYYISKNSRHHVDKGETVRTDEERSTASANPIAVESEELEVAEVPGTINEEQANASNVPENYKQNDEVPAKPAEASSTKRTFSLSSMVEKTPLTKKMDSTLKKVKSKSNAPATDDELSLLWIVILVLLIVWAAGLIGGGWGLGGLINILLVIALVLLILWLLRVI